MVDVSKWDRQQENKQLVKSKSNCLFKQPKSDERSKIVRAKQIGASSKCCSTF